MKNIGGPFWVATSRQNSCLRPFCSQERMPHARIAPCQTPHPAMTTSLPGGFANRNGHVLCRFDQREARPLHSDELVPCDQPATPTNTAHSVTIDGRGCVRRAVLSGKSRKDCGVPLGCGTKANLSTGGIARRLAQNRDWLQCFAFAAGLSDLRFSASVPNRSCVCPRVLILKLHPLIEPRSFQDVVDQGRSRMKQRVKPPRPKSCPALRLRAGPLPYDPALATKMRMLAFICNIHFMSCTVIVSLGTIADVVCSAGTQGRPPAGQSWRMDCQPIDGFPPLAVLPVAGLRWSLAPSPGSDLFRPTLLQGRKVMGQLGHLLCSGHTWSAGRLTGAWVRAPG